MPLLKELIDIPENVQRGDFVLNLSQGLEGEAVHETLAQYVVTPQLAKSFEDALSFIKSTMVGGPANSPRQKGAYLHGSFGSGKSHFMAILHLLLQGNATARAIPELGPAVSKHDDWLQSSNILLVPYHMIGAPSIEAGVLGGYARFIRNHHPNAPEPGFYLHDRLFANAQEMRSKIGDAAFFDALNQGAVAAEDDGWGELSSGWDATSFDAVLNGQTDAQERARLVGDLVGNLFSSVADMATARAGGYVDFDAGISIMSQHAKNLGYDGIVLFLDELILWLASHIADQQFIAHNIQKVVKLVEQSAPRALPMASFIARQRDLKEFVGDHYMGSDQEALSDSLKYWEGRFHTITLEDRNLPVIARRRLLRPKNDAAEAQIQKAFENIDRSLRDDVHNILLTNQGDRGAFRDLYPFSPALVQALVALSQALQRERTALKVMLMLLVSQRDSLELGGVIPVGDLYDVIASEAEPFSEQMRAHFDNARQLFERKFIPMLEQEHQIKQEELEQRPADDTKARAFRNDLRLLKTLVLAALVPEVESFKQLSAQKLAALNHGTIKSPIPGQEAQGVLTRCRRWAGQVGELKISEDGANPTMTLQLSGVDTETILEQAMVHDNDGNRRKLIKDLVFEAFGIQDEGKLFIEHRWLWRGTWRHVEVMFQNIREIEDFTTFQARGEEDWKLIVDFPFDTGTHSPADDRERVQRYQQEHDATRTLCWLPYFLSSGSQRDLGILVRLEYLLKSEDRFNNHSKHLNPVDRAQAHTLLENQRSQLRQRMRDALLGAYGGSERIAGTVDDGTLIPEQVMSLEPGFKPKLPHGATLRQAFEQLLDQALRYQYPDHPEFASEVRLADLGKVFTELRRAIHAGGNRIELETSVRGVMRNIADPLGLGNMYERHFIFKDDWPQRIRRALANQEQPEAALTVARIRQAIDHPRPSGLPEEVQNLLVLVFMEHGQYAGLLHGQDFTPSLKDMPDSLQLLKQELVEAEVWSQALERAAALFGLTGQWMRTANHQYEVVKEVQAQARHYQEGAEGLEAALEERLGALGQPLDGARLTSARAAAKLLRDLGTLEGPDVLAHLAGLRPATSDQALGRSIKSATDLTSVLQNTNWTLFERIWAQGGKQAQDIRKRVLAALAADELAEPLAPVLQRAQREITDLIPRSPEPEAAPVPTPAVPRPGARVLRSDSLTGLTRKQVSELFRDLEAELEQETQSGQLIDVSITLTARPADAEREQGE